MIFRTELGIQESRIYINKRKWKLLNKLPIIKRSDLSKLIKFDYENKGTEQNIWDQKEYPKLINQLENYIIDELRNNKSWKVRKYSKFLKIEGFSFKTKNYFMWKTSNTILKFRTFCSILNRYSYVYHKKSKRNTDNKKRKLQYFVHIGKAKLKI